VAVVEQALADDRAADTARRRRILEWPDELDRTDRALDAAAVAHAPPPPMQPGPGGRVLDRDASGEGGRHHALEGEHRGRGRRRDLDGELGAAAPRRERDEPDRMRRHDQACERGLHPRNTTSTVTSSHATTHSVHATTLAVMPRVTASASGFAAPPFATTSLARPQA
jgi:hypothetical protein